MLYSSWQHKFLNSMAYMMPKWNVYEKYTKLIQSKHQQPHTVIKYDIELVNIYIYLHTEEQCSVNSHSKWEVYIQIIVETTVTLYDCGIRVRGRRLF